MCRFLSILLRLLLRAARLNRVVRVVGDVDELGRRLAPQRAPLRSPLGLGELQAGEAHGVVDDDQRLGVEQRVRAQLALAVLLLELEPLRLRVD